MVLNNEVAFKSNNANRLESNLVSNGGLLRTLNAFPIELACEVKTAFETKGVLETYFIYQVAVIYTIGHFSLQLSLV